MNTMSRPSLASALAVGLALASTSAPTPKTLSDNPHVNDVHPKVRSGSSYDSKGKSPKLYKGKNRRRIKRPR